MATVILSLSLHLTLLLLLVLGNAKSECIIKTLPGYDGELPFKLETGYISLGDKNEKQVFYYFIESERDAHKDPLLLTINGGPGFSALSTLAFEFGPITFNSSTFGWSLPSLVLNPYSWTKMSNIIFIDWPVGSGFSYATTQEGWYFSDTQAPKDLYMFLHKWLLNHPKFIANPLYMFGHSFGGKIAPMLAFQISKANERGLFPQMSLRGYILGSPGIDFIGAINNRPLHAYNLGLISYQYLKEAQMSCNGEYVDVGSDNLECQSALQVINDCLEDVDYGQILESTCPKNDTSTYILLPSSSFGPLCRDMYYNKISEAWANNPSVRTALNVGEGTIQKWVRFNTSVGQHSNHTYSSTIEYLGLLAKQGYPGLVYNGDHDLTEPYFTNLNLIYSLNLTLDDNWRPWKVDGRVAGFTIRYRDGDAPLTFATIKGSGHFAPESTPEECFAMISRWLSHHLL